MIPENLQTEWKSIYKRSRSEMDALAKNEELKPSVRREKINEIHRQTKEAGREFSNRAWDAMKQKVTDTEDSLFGLKPSEFSIDRDQKMKDQRDAFHRALSLSEKQLSEAYDLYSRTGDDTMKKAIAYRAYKSGERTVIDKFVSSNESRQQKFNELNEAKQAVSNKGSQLDIQTAFMTPGKPSVMKDY